jgi:hypothetical protein
MKFISYVLHIVGVKAGVSFKSETSRGYYIMLDD